jgi:NAD(P)-dependent dehydrogenase (short-subunit alcohol dehydrogenase family)
MRQGNDLQDKPVIILGGSSGIGLAVAEQASAEGGKVVVVSSSHEEGRTIRRRRSGWSDS